MDEKKEFETLLFMEMDKIEIDACDWTENNTDNIWQWVENKLRQRRIDELEAIKSHCVYKIDRMKELEKR